MLVCGEDRQRNTARFRGCSPVQILTDNASGPCLPFCTGEDDEFSAQSYLQAVILTSHPCFGQTVCSCFGHAKCWM